MTLRQVVLCAFGLQWIHHSDVIYVVLVSLLLTLGLFRICFGCSVVDSGLVTGHYVKGLLLFLEEFDCLCDYLLGSSF